MYLIASLFALSGLLHQAIAIPKIDERALKNDCNRDNLLRSFVDPRYSSSASAYCSSYIQPTAKSTATVTSTVTPGAANVKRADFPPTTYPAPRLSSACSCILTALPTPTTVVVATITSTVTATSQSCPAAATPIVKNGDFETGALAPWTLTQTYPDNQDLSQYVSFGVKGPGYGGSNNAVEVVDTNGSSYLQIDLSQTLTVCAGKKYNVALKYYQATTDPQAHVYVYVGDDLVTQSPALPITGTKKRSEVAEVEERATPAIEWKDLAGTFTAASGTAVLRISFVATDFLGVTWGADNVVVTPA
ncbi:MAG: hypothetical protein Q9218_003193 [Villophora microphyllina]